MAKLSSEDEKIKILKSGSKLKNTTIFINDERKKERKKKIVYWHRNMNTYTDKCILT